jgi:hypothetical protein
MVNRPPHECSRRQANESGNRRCSAWLGVFISVPAKSTPTRIELYPREFVFCPYRDLRVKGLRIIERRYCHVNPFRTDFVLDKQRRSTTRGERA